VPANDAQQGILAHRQHQPLRQRRSGAAAQRHAEMMDDGFKPERAPRGSAGDRLAEWLRKNASTTTRCRAAKSTNRDLQLNNATVRRKVEEAPFIPAVDVPRLPAAIWALAKGGAASGRDDDPIWLDRDIIDQQASRRQRLERSVYHGQAP